MENIFKVLITGAIILILVGITLAIGSKITQDLRQTQKTGSTTIYTDQDIAADTGTNATLTTVYELADVSDTTCQAVWNSTDNSVIYVANTDYICYSNSQSEGIFSWLNSSDPAITAKINYTVNANVDTQVSSIARNSTSAMVNLSSWQNITSTLIAATVIISLLMAGFAAFLYTKRDV